MYDIEITDPESAEKIFVAAITYLLFESRTQEAETILEQYRLFNPTSSMIVNYEVWLLIQKERAYDALQHANTASGDQREALRAMALQALGDPVWEGIARGLLDSEDPDIRATAQQMLTPPDERSPDDPVNAQEVV